MSTIVLALGDLSCGHCVKAVQKVLTNMEGVEQAEVSLQFAKIVGEVDAQKLIDTIVEAGYQAKLAQADALLALSGLNCGHCVKSVEKALSAVENLDVFEVSKTEAKLYGKLDVNNAIKAIIDAGFEAELVTSPKSDLPTQTCTEPDPVVVELKNDQAINDELPQYHFLLTGMSCAACVAKVQKAIQAVDNVQYVQVNLAESTALVNGEIDPQHVIQSVVHAGYGAELIEDEQTHREKQHHFIQSEIKQRRWQAILALLVGFGLFFWMILGGQTQVTPQNQQNWLIVSFVVLVVIGLTGGHFYRRAWQNLRNRTATMDTLVALGTGMAWLYSTVLVLNVDFFPEHSRHLYFESSAMIIGLINVGKMLEAKAKQRSSKALERLLDLTPKTARVVGEQGEYDLPIQQVQTQMILRLQTGDRVSVDGSVIQGEAWIDESMLTGEPLAIHKQIGDKVSAGTVVNDGTLLFRAEQVGKQTKLANIIRLVRQAQSSKPKIGQLADQIANWFVPVVIVIALIAAITWYLITQQIAYAFVVLTTVLIIACPCALGLATPMSIIAGVGRAAELGILVRDADALQKASQADTIVFDKTGTLTEGKPQVTDIYTFNGFDEKSAVQFAASLEQGANHPLAKAILDYAQDMALEEPQQFSTLKGMGVKGHIANKMVLLGNAKFLQQHEIDVQIAEHEFTQLYHKGATVVFLAIDLQLAAIFAIRDPLRQETVTAIQRLHKQGYQLVMLTGDQEKTAQVIAKEVGIEQVIAGVLPEGKAQAIQQLQQQGLKVVMVGDGINDAPALAQADVSIAMGSGSDIAIETAELTLMRHSIDAIADSLSLAKGTLQNMKQNLFFAFIYNSLGIPLAAGVFYPWLGVLLNPMVGGAAMAFSSITVASNANRLLRFKPKS
ncbi:copper-translocating P-type ATPase [Pasteurellaceae bacterium 22721_9_1]